MVAVGAKYSGQCNVGGWTDIIQIAAGDSHTVGVKADDTVVTVGAHYSGQCNVGNWTNITQVAAGRSHTVGLKSNGTAVAVGNNGSGQCEVSGWTGITEVVAGWSHTVGLKASGTLVTAGSNNGGQREVVGWTNITRIAAGWGHTVGLKFDCTVVAVGDNYSGQCDVGSWTGITEVAAGAAHTVGLKADGTVVAAGPEIELAKWNLGVIEYTLTISSAAGGSVATPSEGVLTYNAGVMVRVAAEPEAGYRFVNWTGDVDTIANVDAALTVITMSNNYSITANFEEKPPINWPLIGGTIAAVVIAGLVIFLVRRRKRKTVFEARLQQ